MSSYFRIGLTLLWVEGVGLGFLIFLSLCELHLTTPVVLLAMSGWSVWCWSAAGLRTGPFLFFFSETRKPVFEEDRRLKDCLGEVLRRASGERQIEILIEEKMELDACAIGLNRIIISRGVLDAMNDDDLKAILAHETGHLRSKDCVIGSAFEMACRLPGTIRWLFRKMIRSRPVRIILWAAAASRLFALALWLSLAYFLYAHRLLLPAILLWVFVRLLGALEKLFRWLLLLCSRFSEYKQDAYAHELGYGRELRQALYKLTQVGPQRVNRWFVLMNSSHPVIFNRIRKLEELEGLR